MSKLYIKWCAKPCRHCRPISLSSILCKLLETFIKLVDMKHLIDQQLLSTKQHCFNSDRSTTTQLLMYLHKCLETILDEEWYAHFIWISAKRLTVFLIGD